MTNDVSIVTKKSLKDKLIRGLMIGAATGATISLIYGTVAYVPDYANKWLSKRAKIKKKETKALVEAEQPSTPLFVRLTEARFIVEETDSYIMYVNADGDLVQACKNEDKEIFKIKGFDIVEKSDGLYDLLDFHDMFKTRDGKKIGRKGSLYFLLKDDGYIATEGGDRILKKKDKVFTGYRNEPIHESKGVSFIGLDDIIHDDNLTKNYHIIKEPDGNGDSTKLSRYQDGDYVSDEVTQFRRKSNSMFYEDKGLKGQEYDGLVDRISIVGVNGGVKALYRKEHFEQYREEFEKADKVLAETKERLKDYLK